MNLFFADKSASKLADDQSLVLKTTRTALLMNANVKEVICPELADAIIIQEKNSFKNFRYVKELHADTLISKYANKIFTINDDDCATGLLKGLYTSLPSFRFDKDLHAAVPYMLFPNELVFSDRLISEPNHLATWRGNTKSNKLRPKLLAALKDKSDIAIQQTDSWLNHEVGEKVAYVELIRKARFSLCPAGWAPVSFRIYETMALGRCPVILADHFVPPSGPNWNDFALFYPEKKVDSLYEFLTVNQEKHTELGEKAYKNWKDFFSVEKIGDYYASSLLSLIKSGRQNSNEHEFQRWKSIRTHWTNEWTIPQRLMNKARQIAAKH